MIRRSLVMTLVLVLGAAPAFAQDKDAPAAVEPAAEKTKRRGDKTKFYDFDDLLVEGELRAPNAYFASARQRMRWGRLLRLKKSFVPTLMSTDKYPILRK